jgi:hypothetical protein
MSGQFALIGLVIVALWFAMLRHNASAVFEADAALGGVLAGRQPLIHGALGFARCGQVMGQEFG